MSGWLASLTGNDAPAVLVSIVATEGSSPRDAGTRMVAGATSSHGTIGGGRLEQQAMEVAGKMLEEHARGTADAVTVSGSGSERRERGPSIARLERFALGARLGQCCGGVAHVLFELVPPGAAWVTRLRQLDEAAEPAVLITQLAERGTSRKLVVSASTASGELDDAELQSRAVVRARSLLRESGSPNARLEPPLLFETIRPERMELALFGAGHVGRAVVRVMAPLPCRITWIDGRPEQFPDAVPANARVVVSDEPADEVADLPAGAFVLVMTHSHGLDQAICEHALRRDDLSWCGLIGSATKRRLFERRLVARGLSSDALSRLVCPIGIDGIDGKHPAEIAIAVAAQILRARAAEDLRAEHDGDRPRDDDEAAA